MPKAPWKKPAPKSVKHKHLSTSQKDKAKARAKKAGRPYPNLVDNMNAAKKKKPSKKKAANKSAKS
jgi:hypothetical protein